MVSDDAGLGINQYRVIEPELGDASGDLSDLGVGVGPGIPGVGYELLDQQCSIRWAIALGVHRNDCTF